jgi:hypothetical protein
MNSTRRSLSAAAKRSAEPAVDRRAALLPRMALVELSPGWAFGEKVRPLAGAVGMERIRPRR